MTLVREELVRDVINGYVMLPLLEGACDRVLDEILLHCCTDDGVVFFVREELFRDAIDVLKRAVELKFKPVLLPVQLCMMKLVLVTSVPAEFSFKGTFREGKSSGGSGFVFVRFLVAHFEDAVGIRQN